MYVPNWDKIYHSSYQTEFIYKDYDKKQGAIQEKKIFFH